MTETEQKTYIAEKMQELGITLSPVQVQQFYDYYVMLVETNKVMNLTAITEFADVVKKHFVDSVIAPAELFHVEQLHMIDVGTGAGFPGIPLKIVYPHMHITLLDSLNKRIRFLGQVTEKLGLEHVTLIHGRAEDAARDKMHREQYQLCVSRAVANLSTLSEYCLPFIQKGGLFVAYKSGMYQEELKQAEKSIKILGGIVEKTAEFKLPGSEDARSMIWIRKEKATSPKYPRKAGVPAKEPL